MALIKSQNTPSVLKDAIVLDLSDIAAQATRLQQAAKRKAEQIIHQAEQRGRQLADQAHADSLQRGYAEGLEKGLAEGRQTGHAEALAQHAEQLTTLQQAWIDAAHTWDQQRAAMQRDARAAVLELALKIAHKIVHRTVAVDHAVIVDQVAAALSHVLRPLDVLICINAEDRPTLEEAMPGLIAQFPNVQHVRLIEDAAITRGGCIVRYGQGQIDAQLETQLDRLVEMLVPTQRPDDAAGTDAPHGGESMPT